MNFITFSSFLCGLLHSWRNVHLFVSLFGGVRCCHYRVLSLCLEECGCDVITIFTLLIQKSLQQGVLLDKEGADATTISFSGNYTARVCVCVCALLLNFEFSTILIQQFDFCCPTVWAESTSKAATSLPAYTHNDWYCFLWEVTGVSILVFTCAELMSLCKFVQCCR